MRFNFLSGAGAVVSASLMLSGAMAQAADKPVPSVCNAAVNSGFAQFVAAHAGAEAEQDNVMVCGTMLRDSIVQHAGHSGAGSHHVLLLSAPTNGTGTPLTLEVVTNDALDGMVTGKRGDQVFAYGQAFVDPQARRLQGVAVSAGVHDTHCSTHAGADNGWVVVAGHRYPANCSGGRYRR